MRATARCARGAHCAGRARVAVAIASRASMSRKGNCWDNAVAESFFATLKTELARLKREVRDDDQLADVQLPNGVDGPVARLRGK